MVHDGSGFLAATSCIRLAGVAAGAVNTFWIAMHPLAQFDQKVLR